MRLIIFIVILVSVQFSLSAQSKEEEKAIKALKKAFAKSTRIESTKGKIVQLFEVKLKKKFNSDYVIDFLDQNNLILKSQKSKWKKGKFEYFTSFIYCSKKDQSVLDSLEQEKSLSGLQRFLDVYPKEQKLITNKAEKLLRLNKSDSLIYYVEYYLKLISENEANAFDSYTKKTYRDRIYYALEYNFGNNLYSINKWKKLLVDVKNSEYLSNKFVELINNSVYAQVVESKSIDSLKNFSEIFKQHEKTSEVLKYLNTFKSPLGNYFIQNKGKLTGSYVVKEGLKVTHEARDKGFDVPNTILIYEVDDEKVLRFVNKSDTSKVVILYPKSKGRFEFEYPNSTTLNTFLIDFNSSDIKLMNESIFRNHTLGFYNRTSQLILPQLFFNFSELAVIQGVVYNISSKNGCLVKFKLFSSVEWEGDCDKNHFAQGNGTIRNHKNRLAKRVFCNDFTGEFKNGLRDGYGCYLSWRSDDCGTWKRGKRIQE